MIIVYAIFLILAGLGILIYGMSLFSRALEASMGHSLNYRFMRVASHPYQSYFLSAILTCLTQKSILVSNMIMNYVNIGTFSLRSSIPFILGLSFGNAISILLLIFQGFNLAIVLSLCCFIGALINLLGRSEKSHNIAKAFVGFGMLFLGLQLVSTYEEELFAVESIFSLMEHLNYPVLIILFAFLFSLVTTSNFAGLTILASLVASGPISVEVACVGMLTVAIGSAVSNCFYATPGQTTEAKRVVAGHILVHFLGFVILSPLYYTGVYQWLYSGLNGNIVLTLIIVHIVQMTLPILLVPFGGVCAKFLRLVVRERKGDTDPSKEFMLPDTMIETFSTGYLGILNSTKKILTKGSDIQNTILVRIKDNKDMRGINGDIQGVSKAIKISNNAILRMTSRINSDDIQKANVLVNIFNDLSYLNERAKKLSAIGAEMVKKPRLLSKEEINKLCALNEHLATLTKLDIALIDDILNGKTIDSEGLKCVLEYNKEIYNMIQEHRREVYEEYRTSKQYPEGDAYFTALVNFETVNTSLENIAIKLGILSG